MSRRKDQSKYTVSRVGEIEGCFRPNDSGEINRLQGLRSIPAIELTRTLIFRLHQVD